MNAKRGISGPTTLTIKVSIIVFFEIISNRTTKISFNYKIIIGPIEKPFQDC